MTNIISVSEARENLTSLVAKVDKTMDRVIITVNGKAKATLISSEELDSLEETNEILATEGALESILQGKKEAEAGLGITLEELMKKDNLGVK